MEDYGPEYFKYAKCQMFCWIKTEADTFLVAVSDGGGGVGGV